MPTLAGLNRRVFGVHRKSVAIDVQPPPAAAHFQEAVAAKGLTLGSLSAEDLKDLEVVRVKTRGDYLTGPTDEYHLGKRLGAGSYGEVRTLRCIGTNRLLAAKKIVSRTAHSDALREAQAARIAHCPTAPELMLVAEDAVYLVNPLMSEDLSSVEEHLTSYAMAEREEIVLSFASQLLQQLQYLHDARWVHLDIKGQNMLRRGPSIFLADFGSAQTLANLGQIHAGYTPMYAAPEIISADTHDKVVKDARAADVWSLGVVLLTCLGGYPFRRYGSLTEAHRDWKLWSRTGICRTNLQPARDALAQLSKPTRKLITDMMDCDPTVRLTAYEALRRVEKQRAAHEAHVDLAALFAATDSARGSQLGVDVGLTKVPFEQHIGVAGRQMVYWIMAACAFALALLALGNWRTGQKASR